MEKEIIKTIPLSLEGYIVSIEKDFYLKDEWSISAYLKKDGVRRGLLSVNMKNSWTDEFKRATEEEVIAECELYLTKMGSYEQAVDKIVDWWAENSFDAGLNQNNGDQSDSGGMAFLLMNFLSLESQKEVTPEKIQAFKEHLKDAIIKEQNYDLSVDYQGDKLLTDALEFAGINSSCLPIKSCSRIDRETNVARASLGYHGEFKFL